MSHKTRRRPLKKLHLLLKYKYTMMASRTIITRFTAAGVASKINTPSQARLLSTQGDAALQKLRSALEEYRMKK
jgi:hypothetical protein